MTDGDGNHPTNPQADDLGRLLVVSYCVPPMTAGPAFVMGSLLRRFRRDLVVFAGNPGRYFPPQGTERPVPAREFDVPPWWPEDRAVTVRGRTVPVPMGSIGNIVIALRMAGSAVRVLRRPDVRGLFVVYPKQHFLLGACVASLFSRKPFLVYFMDIYVEGVARGRPIARVIERYIFHRASVLFAMSEPHRQALERKIQAGDGLPWVVEIPHPWDEPQPRAELEGPLRGRPAIVFAGAIYDAQAESIRRLIEVIENDLPELDPVLHLFTASDPGQLAAFGIRPSERVRLAMASRAQVLAAQRAADILFLPIAFDANEHVAVTASPTKMPEYLAAGTPILVHAPPRAFVTKYAEERGFAEVVKEPDRVALAAAVKRLALEPEVRERLCAHALETLALHDADLVARRMEAGVDQGLAAGRA